MLATLPSSAWPSVWRNWSGLSQGFLRIPDLPSFAAAGAAALPDAELLAGIAAYRRHPWARAMEDPPVIWQEGESRLLDYGPPEGRPVVFVPSLVNRAYVLDLLPEHSMLRFLAQGRVRPLLLDWGFPGEVERGFTMTDYVAGRLERALLSVGERVTLAGYCMGGLMAVAAAQRRPDLVERLVLIATPWDFHAADPAAASQLAGLLPVLEPALTMAGALPIDALQMLFALLDPGSVGAKYRDFGRQDQAGARARMFVAVEDWLADGVPLAAPVARETLAGWYGANTPAHGRWRIAGWPVQPRTLRLPCWIATPGRDRIVPPQSALALAGCIEGAVLHAPRAGHVGMVAGSGARDALWQPLLDWLNTSE
jgi:poly(3-hydroxyalkanoate) synthetase